MGKGYHSLVHSHKAYFRKRVNIIKLPSHEDKTLDLSFSEEGQVLTARVPKVFQKQQDKKKIGKGWNNISLWPKTNEEGKLSEETAVRHIFTKDDFKELGTVIGKLVDIKSQKEIIVVEIHPKKQRGKPQWKFDLVLKASSEVIETCYDKENQDISMDCEIDKESLSLIAKSVEART